jgi:hypothetical protein
MKLFLSVASVLLLATAMPVQAKAVKCQGELYRATPPVPNYPTHIRNVVWRNAKPWRDACQPLVSSSLNQGAAPSTRPGKMP